MEKCTVVYKAPALRPDAKAAALAIIDDILTVQMAVASIPSRPQVETALRNIQRQARTLLTAVPACRPVDGLVELVTRLERGAVVPVNELRQTLTILDVAAAKIRNHLSGGAGNGMGQPVA